MTQHRVILDTDIGGDIDDAFALALLLRCPEIELGAVTTTFGNVVGRGATAAAMCEAAGIRVPVAAGCARTLASRPAGDPLDSLFTYRCERWEWYEDQVASRYGVDTLIAEMRLDSDLISIGPMTNLAVALALDVTLPTRAGTVIAMCGEFDRANVVEFNVRCDPEAAHLVFSSELGVDVIPLSIGVATKLDDREVKRLEASEDQLVKLLVAWLHDFWRHSPGKTNMYDPMTVVALLRPELFDWRRGRVSVELRDAEMYGLTRFTPDDDGPHRVAFGVRAAEAKAFLLERLLGPARAA